MAGEVELDPMIVRLLGDAESYVKSMEQSAKASQDAAKEIETQTKKIEGFGNTLKGIAAAAVSALASIGAAGFLKEALGNFQEAEGISLKLTAVLESNGREVEALTEQYNEFAAGLQAVTIAEDDAILAMLATAESFGVTGKAAEKAVEDSVALAAVVSAPAESLMRFTAALAKGDTEVAMSMSRMIPQLRGITDESEFLAKAQHLVASGMKAAEAETKSSAGTLKILSRDYGNMLEDLGKVVAQGIAPFVKGLSEAVKWLASLDSSTKTVIVSVAAFVAALAPLLGALAIIKVTITTLIPLYTAMKAAIVSTGVATAATSASMAVWGTSIAAAVVLAYQLSKAIYGLNRDVQNLNSSLAEGEKLQGVMGNRFTTETTRIVENVRTSNDANVAAEQLKKAQIELEGYQAQVRRAQKNVEDLNTTWNNWTGNKVLAVAKGELEKTEERLGIARERVTALNAEVGKFKAPQMDKKLVQDVKELTKGLELQVQTFGMTGEAAAIYKLQLQGASEEMLANARGLAQMNEWLAKNKKETEEAAEKAKQLAEKLTEAGAAITKEFATPFETFEARVAELNELLDAGAISEEVFGRAMEDAEKKLDEVGKQAKTAHQEIAKFDAALSGSAESASRIEAFRDMMVASRAGGAAAKSAAGGMVAAAPMVASAPAGPAANEHRMQFDRMVEYLKQIAQLTLENAKKPALDIDVAGL